MHVVFITPKFIPNSETGGAAIYNYSAIQHLIENGHQATVIHFDCLHHNPIYPQAAEYLKKNGVRVCGFSQPPITLQGRTLGFLPGLQDNFPYTSLAENIVPFLKEIKPDLIFAYGDGAMAPIKDVKDIPIVVQIGDHMNLLRYIRWLYDFFYGYSFGFNMATLKWPLRFFQSLRTDIPSMLSYPRHLKSLLKHVACLVTVCPQHIEYYEKFTGKKCYFTPIPMMDTIGTDWEVKRQTSHTKKGEKIKLLWVGKPANTENQYAVRFLVRELFPELIKLISVDSFDLHVVGDNRNCPPELVHLSQKHPNVYIRGHVHDIDSEWLSADVNVVTNTTSVGVRTRILSSFSGGNCVVAHVANTASIPALMDGENILIGRSGYEMAKQIHRAIQDEALCTRLGRNGRRVFEQVYEKSVAAQVLVDIFQKTVGEFSLTKGNHA